MNWKIFMVTLLSVAMLISTVFTSCSPAVGSPAANPSDNSEFEVIRQAADAWVNNGKEINITSQGLYDAIMTGIGLTDYKIEWYDPLNYQKAPLVVDVRGGDSEMPDPYTSGHIPGSFAVPWRSVADSNYLRKLDKGRQIAIVSGTGQNGAEVAAILGVLGYDTINMMYGMTAWTSDPLVAPGRYDAARDTVWDWSGSYRAVCPISEPSDIYPYPIVNNTASKDTFDIIQSAAIAYLHSGKPANMPAQELYHALYFEELKEPLYFFTNPVSPAENPWSVPFLLDVRTDDSYENGHLCGTLHFYYKDLFKPENLQKLPPDRQILVYSDTGHESGMVTALLNMLGYDAINLKWGIAGWSLSLPGKDVAPERFIEERDCINAAIITGYQSFLPCPG
jgi:rhodanese-related sulfurtransferase